MQVYLLLAISFLSITFLIIKLYSSRMQAQNFRLLSQLELLNNEYERCSMLSAMKYVDRIETFDSDQELIDLIKNFDPDVMVKGGDYRDKPIIGAEYCKDIKFYDRFKHYSTTDTIQRINKRE